MFLTRASFLPRLRADGRPIGYSNGPLRWEYTSRVRSVFLTRASFPPRFRAGLSLLACLDAHAQQHETGASWTTIRRTLALAAASVAEVEFWKFPPEQIV